MSYNRHFLKFRTFESTILAGKSFCNAKELKASKATLKQ